MTSYFYHAIYQTMPGEIQHFEGVIELEKSVKTNDDFKDAKQKIMKQIGMPEVHFSRLIIDTFTLMHQPFWKRIFN